MKRSVKIMAVMSVTIFVASACAAQSPRALRQLDSNGDRKLQFSEISSMRGKLFDKGDTNTNGYLEASELDEMRAQVSARGRGNTISAMPDFTDLDINNDDRISRDEFTSYISPLLRDADTNGDGALTRSELRALR